MKRVLHNEEGFTHHILFIVIIIGVIGLIAFTGQRVWVKTQEASRPVASIADTNTPTASSPTSNSSQTQPTSSTKIVKKTGTAAATIAKAPAAPSKPVVKEQVPVKTDQNLKTPQGSFYQLIKELQAKNYVNALYFISPAFLENSAELLKLANVSLDDCKANAACNVLLNTPLENLNTSTVNNYVSSGQEQGKSLVYTVPLPSNLYSGQATESDGTYTITVNMLDATTNWVVDSISVEGYTL